MAGMISYLFVIVMKTYKLSKRELLIIFKKTLPFLILRASQNISTVA